MIARYIAEMIKEGIGLLIVRSAAHGLICVGRSGIHYLDEDRIEGEDPLAVYGELAGAAIKRPTRRTGSSTWRRCSAHPWSTSSCAAGWSASWGSISSPQAAQAQRRRRRLSRRLMSRLPHPSGDRASSTTP